MARACRRAVAFCCSPPAAKYSSNTYMVLSSSEIATKIAHWEFGWCPWSIPMENLYSPVGHGASLMWSSPKCSKIRPSMGTPTSQLPSNLAALSMERYVSAMRSTSDCNNKGSNGVPSKSMGVVFSTDRGACISLTRGGFVSVSFFNHVKSPPPMGVMVMSILPRFLSNRAANSPNSAWGHGSSIQQKSIVPEAAPKVPWLAVLKNNMEPFFNLNHGFLARYPRPSRKSGESSAYSFFPIKL